MTGLRRGVLPWKDQGELGSQGADKLLHFICHKLNTKVILPVINMKVMQKFRNILDSRGGENKGSK